MDLLRKSVASGDLASELVRISQFFHNRDITRLNVTVTDHKGSGSDGGSLGEVAEVRWDKLQAYFELAELQGTFKHARDSIAIEDPDHRFSLLVTPNGEIYGKGKESSDSELLKKIWA